MGKTEIDWADIVWNAQTGCTRGCFGCYAKDTAETRLRGRFGYDEEDPFFPTFHENKLHEPRKYKSPKKIFVCSMGDLLDPHVPDENIIKILDEIAYNTTHTFQLLTKRPDRLFDFRDRIAKLKNLWIGVSQDGKHVPTSYVSKLAELNEATIRMVSFEPLLGSKMPSFENIDWLIIGAFTKKGRTIFMPNIEWVDALLDMAKERKMPVFLKHNLNWFEERREFPKPKPVCTIVYSDRSEKYLKQAMFYAEKEGFLPMAIKEEETE